MGCVVQMTRLNCCIFTFAYGELAVCQLIPPTSLPNIKAVRKNSKLERITLLNGKNSFNTHKKVATCVIFEPAMATSKSNESTLASSHRGELFLT